MKFALKKFGGEKKANIYLTFFYKLGLGSASMLKLDPIFIITPGSHYSFIMCKMMV